MKNSEQTNLQNEEGNSIRPDFTHTAAVNIMAEMFQGEELGSSSGIKSTPGISVSDVLTQMEQLEEMEFQEALLQVWQKMKVPVAFNAGQKLL
jgi:hypothetical protein